MEDYRLRLVFECRPEKVPSLTDPDRSASQLRKLGKELQGVGEKMERDGLMGAEVVRRRVFDFIMGFYDTDTYMYTVCHAIFNGWRGQVTGALTFEALKKVERW